MLGRMKTSVPIRMLGAGWQRAQCLMEGDLNRVCVGSSSQGVQGLSAPPGSSSPQVCSHPGSLLAPEGTRKALPQTWVERALEEG